MLCCEIAEPHHLMQAKMEAGQYSSVAEFEQDMLLIWDNCMIYNRVRT